MLSFAEIATRIGVSLQKLAKRHLMKPILVRTKCEMSDWSAKQQGIGLTIALVPTMGALHAGHLKLVEEASKVSDFVVISIFVNPTQFGPGEDLDAYPRVLNEDVYVLENQGLAAVIFAPEVTEIYPNAPNLTWVEVDAMGDHLCGASRPGHFRGVTTVVSRLLSIINPDLAVFGLKDAQQFFILKRMAQEMGFRTAIIGIPTVRESDGLALSSRNRYLNELERSEAVFLSKAVQVGKKLISTGSPVRAVDLLARVRQELSPIQSGTIDYVEFVDTKDLQPVLNTVKGQTVLVAVAVKFGKARLIDNSIVEVG